MNEFRIFFQIFLIIVFFSGIYVIFWLDKYHESFDDSIDPSITTTLNNSTDEQPTNVNSDIPIFDTITTTLAPYVSMMLPSADNANQEVTINNTNEGPSPQNPNQEVTINNDNPETSLQNPNEPIHFTSPDGTISVSYTNDAIIYTSPDGKKTVTSPDNSITITNNNGKINILNTNNVITNPDGSLSITDKNNTISISIAPNAIVETKQDGFATIQEGIENNNGTVISDSDKSITIKNVSSNSISSTTPGVVSSNSISSTTPGVVSGNSISSTTPGVVSGNSMSSNAPSENVKNTIIDTTKIGTTYIPVNKTNLLTTLAPINAIVNNRVTDYKFPITAPGNNTSNNTDNNNAGNDDTGNNDTGNNDTGNDDTGNNDAGNPGNNSQNLDDYILNDHPVDVSPESTMNDDGQFLPSTMAYPGSGYAAFDPLNEDINHYEYVAKEFASSQPDGLSDNPMDPNWGGVMYTQNMIKSGKYVDNNVNKPLLFQPKGIYIDNIPSAFGKPKDIY